jgi:hypothetical protein
MSNYGYTETNLPKGAQQELDDLRRQVITLRAAESARLIAHVIRLDQDWFVMPGPANGTPVIRLWVLGEQGPQLLGTLANGQSLMFQQAKESEG